MTISIVIPIYNVAPYIEECLRSVFAQTYQEDVECLLVDDCGTDCSMAIAERMIATYDGKIDFRLIRHDHNRGLSAARNTGVLAAHGRYICFMDSDDLASPQMLERLVSALQTAPEDVCVVTGFFYDNPSTGHYVETSFDGHRDHDYVVEPQDFALRQLTMDIPHEAWGRLIRRDLLIEVPFRVGRKIEDRLWVLDAMPVVERRMMPMMVIKDFVYYYRKREDSICNDKSTPILFEDIRVCQEVLRATQEDHPAIYVAERKRYIWCLSSAVHLIATQVRPWRELWTYYKLLIQISDNEAARRLPAGVLTLYKKMKYQGVLVWFKHRFRKH